MNRKVVNEVKKSISSFTFLALEVFSLSYIYICTLLFAMSCVQHFFFS